MKLPEIKDCSGDVTVSSWKKSVGESVAAGELLLQVECDKASVDIYSEASGTIIQVFFQEGEIVKPGDVIAKIE